MTAGRRGLLLVLLLVAVVDICGIWWGLPNRDHTWATDELGPVAPLAIVKRAFSEPFNSGWFYFKYPLGHPLLLGLVYSPVIALAWMTGHLGTPAVDYPYGLASPDLVLTILTCLGRMVSVVAALLLVWLVARITERVWGGPGSISALLVGLCYPFVYYAHTGNVDMAFIAWSALALWAAMRARADAGIYWYCLVGGAAALAVATKEPAVGFVLPVIALALSRRWHSASHALAPASALIFSGLVVWSVANLAVWNPGGAVNRVRYLIGLLPEDLVAKYAAYSLPVSALEGRGFRGELAQLWRAASAVGNSLGVHVALLGLASLIWLGIKQPARAVWLWLPGVSYYLIAVRPMNVLSLRYTMPLTLLLAIAAGAVLSRLAGKGWLGRIVVAALLLPTLLAGAEVDRLLLRDPRYQAESWLSAHAKEGMLAEVYQRATYLPRFPRGLVVSNVPMPGRRVELFLRRHPDLVVLSSASRQRLDHNLNPNWRDGRPSWLPVPYALHFFERFRSGALGYREVARFKVHPFFLDEHITSLNPETVILAPAGFGE